MERDFEKEFIELKQSEAPDLWSRIEAGLTPKNVENTEMEAEQTAESESAATFEQKPGRKVRIYRWGLLAAACLCLLIILPVLSLTRSNSFSSDMSGAGAPTSEGLEASAADESFDMAAEAASDAADNGGSEIQSAESMENEILDSESGINGYTDASAGADGESAAAGTMDDSVSNSVTNGAEVSRSEAASAADSMFDDSDAQKDEMKELQGVKAVDWNDILQEGQMLHEVKIEVSEVVQTDTADQIYTVRTVVVSSDEDGFLYEGAELTLLCNEETTYDFVTRPRKEILLQVGKTYIADLRYEGDGGFVVVKIL